LETLSATPGGGIPTNSPPTLGDVLYANQDRARLPETQWVALVTAIASGDQLALHEFYERSHRIVFTLIMRTVRDRATAEELTLDVFHHVWQRAGTYDSANGTVIGWIMNQARSRAIDQLRFEQRKKRVNPHPDEPEGEPAARAPQDAADSAQQGQLLRAALTILTGAEREAIEAAYFAECSYSEAARRLQQPIGTVKTRIRSGLIKLRHALAAEGDAT
jgi:RNA polymerase sigma-70 factor, ECF subfamily